MKAKSRNVKLQFENLRNKSVTISDNVWYFLITLRLHVKNLKTVMNVWNCVTLCCCRNVSSLTFLVTDTAIKSYVRKLCTKTRQTGKQFYVSIGSASCVSFTPDSYVIKPYKRNEKIYNYYVWRLRQNYDQKLF